MGVNIGDIIVEAHDIFGDGVNIAARLEGIAEPGGICISSSAYDQVRGKVGVEFADLGEQNLKNIARPVRAYAMIRGGHSLRHGLKVGRGLALHRLVFQSLCCPLPTSAAIQSKNTSSMA